MGVSFGGVTVCSNFRKQSILKSSQQYQYCFNGAQILYYGRCELIVHVKIYFTKIDVVSSEILAGQKSIK
jgi:hypothetical protein